MRTNFFVSGLPVPKGSKNGYLVNGRIIIADVRSAELKAWEAAVADAAYVAADGTGYAGAVSVNLKFYLLRPKTVKREWPTVPPDLDKLERSVLDGLTKSGVIEDDSRVVELHGIKHYVTSGPGVDVSIEGVR